ncbi:hypothetical protein FGB62_340g03 [Gracilaria domingensis]|nr:hypothetical protein FGB62_340g03 [Gracilaria domingensis]
MVSIAIRNITLAIYAIGDPEALKYAARDEQNYLVNTVHFLSRICGSVARAFELLLDDGREVRRTRTRTGIFRRKVIVSDVTDRLEEIENICSYLNDVCVISNDILCPVLVLLTSTRFISPFFLPLASLASPEAVRARNKLWRLGNRQKKTLQKTALASFDAAARWLLLSCILKSFRSSVMAESVSRELRRFCNDFDQRSILHALKAMASDIPGTERVTFVALCTIEAFIECESVGKHFLYEFKYDFRVEDPNRNGHDELAYPRLSFLDLEAPHQDDLEPSHDEPMLMTLSEFEAPRTPSNSLPSTLDRKTAFSDGTLTPTVPSRAISSASLSSELSSSITERTGSEGILFSFQMGEATLREALSSIILIVRRREIRSMRVLHAITRIMTAIEAKRRSAAFAWRYSCVIEPWHVQRSTQTGGRDVARSCALMASMFPKGTGKRRALFDDAIVLTEIEDSDTFFVMMYAYERSLGDAGITTLPKLVLQARDILLEYNLPDSYLDKRDALMSFAEVVSQHGEIELKT